MAIRSPVWGLEFFAVLLLTGCGASDRHQISGEVKFDGQPVEYGIIFFNPDTSKGATGPQGSAEIRQGRYKTESDKGPVSGAHVVKITGWKGSPESGVLGAPLFRDHTVQVDISNSNQLDFDIPAPARK